MPSNNSYSTSYYSGSQQLLGKSRADILVTYLYLFIMSHLPKKSPNPKDILIAFFITLKAAPIAVGF